ncbi:NAD(P)H-dependent oxidoreductase [Shinella sp.]|uniref:NAD(P)H-dependent oxidoreductase n=1 Tax=Shinella sp. TaxID=1870904 RepID=UPI003F7235CD
MHALIVVSHPKPGSFTHSVANQVAEGIAASGAHSFEIADLAAEGFDPRFSAQDHAFFVGEGKLPADIAAEQARLDRSDALVLVYPVYWWSFPGLLKGWIDRVFTNGWAYVEEPDGKIVRKLGRLPVHLIAVAGANMRTYARHGYFGAMKTQIDHGIFDYCGAPVARSELLVPDERSHEAHLDTVRTIGRTLFAG